VLAIDRLIFKKNVNHPNFRRSKGMARQMVSKQSQRQQQKHDRRFMDWQMVGDKMDESSAIKYISDYFQVPQ